MATSHKKGETWLVVASTGAALVNLVCATAFGLEKFDRLLFLTGIPAGSRSNARPLEAQRGMDYLQAAINQEFAIRHIAPKITQPASEIVDDMNDPTPWIMKLREFFGAGGIGSSVARIVYVYTGGTKDMALGCWDGLASIRDQRPDITIEFVSKQAHRIHWPKEPQRSIALRGGASHVSLQGYMLAHGYRITNLNETKRQEFAQKHERQIRDLANTLLKQPKAVEQNWMALLNRLAASQKSSCDRDGQSVIIRSLGKNDVVYRSTVDFASFAAALGPSVRELAIEAALHFDGCHLTFNRGDAEQARFQGDWFEDFLYLEAKALLTRTQAEIHHGVHIQRIVPQRLHDDDFDIDLAIFANDQLYVAEAKTPLKQAAVAIDKLTSLRKAVVGPAYLGKAWLVSAETEIGTDAIFDKAANRDIVFCSGQTDIAKMMASLPGIVG